MDEAVEQPVDLAVALRWLGDDRRLLRELVEIFMDDCPKRMETMRTAMTTGDAASLGQVAHSVKGSAAILGAARLQHAALALEDATHDGYPASGPQLVADVAREVELVMAFFADPTWTERLDLEASP